MFAQTVITFARSDDYFFGVLHSSVHELWALRMGTQLEDRPRYTPTTCFETFALPWCPGSEPAGTDCGEPGRVAPARGDAGGKVERGADGATGRADTARLAWERISGAARELNELRERWLNPPEWIGPLAKTVDALDGFSDVPDEARALIRQSAIMAAAAKDVRLKKRTLTNLYNQRPEWLKAAHEKLDRAVLGAYALVDAEGGWQEDWALVWRDSGAGQALENAHPLALRRGEVDQQVLANLLRLNRQRQG